MKTRNKKGFTIVELVIVIAVIGILTAILVPVFINLTNKANRASDDSLVKNLNTAMAMEEGEGKTNNTYHDAIQYLDNYGFKLENLATKSEYSLLWNSKTNRFLLNEESAFNKDQTETRAADHQYWTIQNSIPEGNKFSIYAGLGWNEANPVVVDGIGFDAGNHNPASVTYNNSESVKNVTLRTNSAATSLTINDTTESTIKHYGAAGALSIIQCHTESYHEYGQVAFAEIATGRIVLESESKVEHIHLNTSEVNSETVFNNITVAKASDVEMPEFSRDPVEIPEEGKLVVTLQDGTETTDDKDYIWLTAVGIFEQVTLGTADVAGSNFVANSTNEEKRQTAQQIANNITATVSGNEYTLTATTTDDGQTWSYSLSSDTEEAITENVAVSVETIEQEKVVTISVAGQAQTTNNKNGLDESEKQDVKESTVETAVSDEVINKDEVSENYVARIGTKGYAELSGAFSEVKAGETIILLKDNVLKNTITVSKEFTLDLHGNKLVFLPDGNNTSWGPRKTAFSITSNGIFTLKDSAVQKGVFEIDPPYTSALTFASNDGTMNLYGVQIKLAVTTYNQSVNATLYATTNATNRASVYGLSNYGVLNVKNSVLSILCQTNFISNYKTMNVLSSTFNVAGSGTALCGNASNNVASNSNIEKCTIVVSEKGTGINLNGANATIKDCSILMSGVDSMSASSAYGISVNKSATNYVESSVRVTGNTYISIDYTGSGAEALSINAGYFLMDGNVVIDDINDSGYALRFGASALSGFENAAKLDIMSGTFNGDVSSFSKNGFFTIHNGTFNGELDESYVGVIHVLGGNYANDPSSMLVEGISTASQENDRYVVTKNQSAIVATVNEFPYASLASALSANGTDNGIVKLEKDCSETIVIDYAAEFDFDLNGHSFTGSISAEDGYTMTKEENHYSILPPPEAQIGEHFYATLGDAIQAILSGTEANESTIIILRDTSEETKALNVSSTKTFTISNEGGYAIKTKLSSARWNITVLLNGSCAGSASSNWPYTGLSSVDDSSFTLRLS